MVDVPAVDAPGKPGPSAGLEVGLLEAPGEPGSDGSFIGGRSAPIDEEVRTVRGGWRLLDDESVAA